MGLKLKKLLRIGKKLAPVVIAYAPVIIAGIKEVKKATKKSRRDPLAPDDDRRR